MSCEDHDYGWDDVQIEPIIEVRKINLAITTISQKELCKIEEAMTMCLDRKFDKLNLLLRQMNVYQLNDCLIVNDRYNTAPNLVEIVKSFGMDVKTVTVSGLKGKTYIIGDKITKLLSKLGTDYDFSKTVDVKQCPQTVNLDGIDAFRYPEVDSVYDDELASFLQEIKHHGEVRIVGSETLIDGVSQGIVSDKERVTSKLKQYLSDVQKQACENNRNVQNGTTEILYARARQMGYSVQKEVKGKQVQLVLVRME